MAQYIKSFAWNGEVYAKGVHEHAINGERLLQLTAVELRDLLNVRCRDTRRRILTDLNQLAMEDDNETYKNAAIRLIGEMSPDDKEFADAKSLLLQHMGIARQIDKVEVLKVFKVSATNHQHVHDGRYNVSADRCSPSTWIPRLRRTGSAWPPAQIAARSRSRPASGSTRRRRTTSTTPAWRVSTRSCTRRTRRPTRRTGGLGIRRKGRNGRRGRAGTGADDPVRDSVYVSRLCTQAILHVHPDFSSDALEEVQSKPLPVAHVDDEDGLPPVVVQEDRRTLRILEVVMVECYPGPFRPRTATNERA